jgi:flap endonuclease-1
MGILNLTEILKKHCSNAIHKRSLDNYKGQIVGVDVSIFLYKFVRNDMCLEGMIKLILRLLKNFILPVFIFDGKPPKEKSDVIEDRKEKREILEIKREVLEKCINEKENKSKEELIQSIKEVMQTKNENVRLNDEEIVQLVEKNDHYDELEKTKKNIIYIRSEHIELTKNICNFMGVPYIVSKGEAETLLANLSRDGIIDCIISEDTDVLVGGGKIFLRDFMLDNNQVTEYCLQGILDNLEFTYDQFIDMCILCGCDYTSKVSNVGPVSAHKLIKTHINIENVLVELGKKPEKYKVPDNFDYNQARYLFKNALVIENIEEVIGKIKMKTPNIEGLNQLIYDSNSNLHEKYREEINLNLMEYIKIIKNYLPNLCQEFIYQNTNTINNLNDNTNVQNDLSSNISNHKHSKGTKKITSFFTVLPKDSKK